MMMENIEFTVLYVMNDVLRDIIKIIRNHKLIKKFLEKDNE